MTHSKFRALTGLAVLAIALTLSAGAWGQATETVLFNFQDETTGEGPQGLSLDASGNLWGVTQAGGTNGFGTVFELSPVSGGGWNETVLYSFVGGAGGEKPQSKLISDAAGNLYGTALGGSNGYGIVYKLTSGKSGWQQTVLYTFTGGSDGGVPSSGLVMDAAGNLYGSTAGGGKSLCFESAPCGVVYKLSFVPGVGWRETVLHSFSGKDGANPRSTPILDASGNLYGTATDGGWVSQKGFCGMLGCGVVYELSHVAGGWKETVLHTFVSGPSDGGLPAAGLASDASGNLYGVTTNGGSWNICGNGSGCGVVFELSPSSNGTWTESILHRFSGRDGWGPYATPALDAGGNIYGTASAGGNGFGTAYELSPSSSGWAFNTIFNFSGFAGGWASAYSFVLDNTGNLYGASAAGGTSNNNDCVDSCGLVFKLTP
jgi:uncharacterized repeat protein (TIGR03803 family)